MLRASASDVAAQFRSDHRTHQTTPERERERGGERERINKHIYSRKQRLSFHDLTTSYIGDPDSQRASRPSYYQFFSKRDFREVSTLSRPSENSHCLLRVFRKPLLRFSPSENRCRSARAFHEILNSGNSRATFTRSKNSTAILAAILTFACARVFKLALTQGHFLIYTILFNAIEV